jgi:hypothetical protein
MMRNNDEQLAVGFVRAKSRTSDGDLDTTGRPAVRSLSDAPPPGWHVTLGRCGAAAPSDCRALFGQKTVSRVGERAR